jgi:polyisoprenoid-binding protein YceI
VRFDPSTADCFVFTYKQGLLSPVAHDLKLRVTAFTIQVSDDYQTLEAVFEAASLRVEAVMRDGQEVQGVLSEKDQRQIEANIARDVLEAQRFPQIRFAAGSIARREGRALIAGTLTLHGYSRLFTVEAGLREGDWSTTARLHQPDFGIRPYSAMLGTLRIQPDVRVQVVLRPPR